MVGRTEDLLRTVRGADVCVDHRSLLLRDFELQPAERLLLKAGAPVAIGPRAFDVLVALVERHGHLVIKEDRHPLRPRAMPCRMVSVAPIYAFAFGQDSGRTTARGAEPNGRFWADLGRSRQLQSDPAWSINWRSADCKGLQVVVSAAEYTK